MHTDIYTYKITYENKTESQKSRIKGVRIFQYVTIKAPNIKTALEVFEETFCWEAVKIQKIN